MERTKEQKTLNVFAIISLVAGIIGILSALLIFVFGGVAVGNAGEIASQGAGTAEEVTNAGIAAIGSGIATLITGIVQLVDWAMLKKLVNDATKYKGAQTLTTIGIIISAIGAVTCIFGKEWSTLASNLVSIGIDAYILSLINKIKQA